MAAGEAIVAQNRRARRDYEILDRYEAGLALTGSEIKSIRLGKVDIQGAYGRLRKGEAWLLDAYIAPYANAGYTPTTRVATASSSSARRNCAGFAPPSTNAGSRLCPSTSTCAGGWPRSNSA